MSCWLYSEVETVSDTIQAALSLLSGSLPSHLVVCEQEQERMQMNDGSTSEASAGEKRMADQQERYCFVI